MFFPTVFSHTVSLGSLNLSVRLCFSLSLLTLALKCSLGYSFFLTYRGFMGEWILE